MSFISISNLSFKYSRNTEYTLRNINLQIERGEFILLSGPTGCGKTTLCRCLTGLIPQFHSGVLDGEVLIDGLNTKKKPVYEIAKKVGMVFQNPENQLVAQTVERDLGFAMENLGYPPEKIRSKIEEIIKKLQLEPLRNKAPYELSGGEQQQVAIASILTLGPDIIILDEPTSNLDPVAAKNIMRLLKDLNLDENKTIILIEHRLELVVPLINRVLIMDDGEIILDGTPGRVLADEKVKQLGLGVPKVIQLSEMLKEAGLQFEKMPLTPLELAHAIRSMK
ncbi:MAG: ATP-binding cassette domain-containing protein [Candidatus Helarchaeota archaeon]|nr:ATP-binding cassette domain-containing protein [Candidatus Helarchaeota archaeon]